MISGLEIIIVYFLGQLRWAKGCQGSWLNIISKPVYEGVSGQDSHLNCRLSKGHFLPGMPGHHPIH